MKQYLVRRLARGAMAVHRGVFRLSRGRVGGRMFGAPVLMLTTIGRRTGKDRVTPLLYLSDGHRLVVVASNGGSDRVPTWYLNLRRHPEVEVDLGGERKQLTASVADPQERAELWPRVVELYGGYAGYQERTRRRIPLVILSS